jgi:hypothetical protein
MCNRSKPVRRWQEIAEEASREQDATKLQELIQELIVAMDADGMKLPQQLPPENKRQQSA